MAGVSSLRFSCSVCSKDYTQSGDHVPKLLPCTHTVCGHCVENKLFRYLVRNLDCPVCCKEHHYCDGVKSVAENQYILVMIRKGQGDACKTHQKEVTPVCVGCVKDDHKEHRFSKLKKSVENPLDVSAVELESFKNTTRVKIEALEIENVQRSETCKEQIKQAREQIFKKLNEHFDKLVAEVNERKITIETRLHDAAEKVEDKFRDETMKRDVESLQVLKIEMKNLMSEFDWYRYLEFREAKVSDNDLRDICGSLIQKYFLSNVSLQEITTTSDKGVNSTRHLVPEKGYKETTSTTSSEPDVNYTRCPAPKKRRKENAFTTNIDKDGNFTEHPVPKKNLEALKEGVDSLKMNIEMVTEGKESDETDVSKGATQKNSTPNDPDHPPDPSMAGLVRAKRLKQRREIRNDLPEIQTGNTRCPVCDTDYVTQLALVSHYSKCHKNEYLFHCDKCGKGFMSKMGYTLHMAAHNETKRLKCHEDNCEKSFGSRSAVKKHMKEQHPTKEQKDDMKNIGCQYCEKKLKTKQNKREHECGCPANPDRIELFCEVCNLGGFFINKRVLQHKRNCHGWEG